MPHRVLTSAFAAAVFMLGIAGSAIAHDVAASNSVSGIFVSLGTDANGSSVTIQRGTSLRTIRVAPNATVTEAASGTQEQPATLARLSAGEPVELTLDSGGVATAIIARYATVTTQVIAAQNGFIVGADGNAYKLVGAAATTSASLRTGAYVLMRADPATGAAFDVVASSTPFRSASQSSAGVAVTFVVSVPPNTPPGDIVYIATNASSWTPNGLRMTPLAGGRFTVVIQLAPGSQIEYRYTRGSWSTDERTAAGTPTPNRTLLVQRSGSAQSVTDIVARWADLAS